MNIKKKKNKSPEKPANIFGDKSRKISKSSEFSLSPVNLQKFLKHKRRGVKVIEIDPKVLANNDPNEKNKNIFHRKKVEKVKIKEVKKKTQYIRNNEPIVQKNRKFNYKRKNAMRKILQANIFDYLVVERLINENLIEEEEDDNNQFFDNDLYHQLEMEYTVCFCFENFFDNKK